MKIEIYTKNMCSYCIKAKSLFQSKALPIVEYNIQLEPSRLSEMLERSNGSKTFPQIFINDKHIGGYDDLVVFIQSGKLENII